MEGDTQYYKMLEGGRRRRQWMVIKKSLKDEKRKKKVLEMGRKIYEGICKTWRGMCCMIGKKKRKK